MNILTGYLSATSGSAKIDGMDILDDPIEAKRHIGYMPEQPPLYFDMTVEEYLNFAAELKGVKSLVETEAYRGDLRECFDYARERPPHQESVEGQKQRVGLAMALIGDPTR